MCSKFDENMCPQVEEEEEDLSELSSSSHSFPTYNPRYSFNERQKSSLGKFRHSQLGAFTARTENSTNVKKNDSGINVSCSSSTFSNTKNDRVTSIFNPTVCKRNIQFHTPCKNGEDKENVSHIPEGRNYTKEQSSLKKNEPSTRLGLFGNEVKNRFDNVNDYGKTDIYDSNGMEKDYHLFEIQPQKVQVPLFNQKPNIFENIVHNSNEKTQEYKDTAIKPQLLEHQPKITLFNSKPDLCENKFFNLNLKDVETISQVNKNRRVTLFDSKPKLNDNQSFNESQESIRQHSNNKAIKNETYKDPNYIPPAPKTIFEKPFIFTVSSKLEPDKGNLSDEFLSTPLDLSSGEHLNKTNLNNTEQSSNICLLENSVNKCNEAASLSGHDVGNEEIVNDSGINVTGQENLNIQSQLPEVEREINLLPTPLILACPKSILPSSGGSATRLESTNLQPVTTERQNIFIPVMKNVNQHTTLNSEQSLLKNECDRIQQGAAFFQPTSIRQGSSTETKKMETDLNMHQFEDLPSTIDQFKTSPSNLLLDQNGVALNQQKTNSARQTILRTKPEVETVIPQIHSYLKTSASEVAVESTILQKPSLPDQHLEIAKSDVPVQAEIPKKQLPVYHNTGSTESEVESIIRSSENIQNVLPVISTNLNKYHLSSVKSDINPKLSVLSFPQHVTDHKQIGSQFFPSASFNSNKFCFKEKQVIATSKHKENNQNVFVQSSVIPFPAHQSRVIVSKLEPGNSSSSSHDSIPYQHSHLHQQSVCHQQQSIVNNVHNNPLLQQQTPVVGQQPKLQNCQSANQLHQVQIVKPVQSYNTNDKFLKPLNPAPRFDNRLSDYKSKPTGSKPISNMQANFATSTGISTQQNQWLCVNGKTYTILSTLGKGGSSTVYQVLDHNTSNLMAVKCVDLTMVDHTIAEGYLNEIDLLSKLQGCATVIKMFDHEYVKESKMLYVVMEKGDTDLSKLIRDICKTTKMSVSMIIYYWTEMLTVVRDIHEKGIIHSDLKPANFLLVSGRLKLIDFGIASSLQGDMTSVQKEVTSGTWNYMSPEAIRNTGGSGQGFKITYRSDVWSLGCILYNLLYGKTPFSHITHTWSKLQAIADSNHKIEFPPVNIPPVLDRALRSCFHRDPKQRPTVAQLLDLPYTTVDQISLHQEVKKVQIILGQEVKKLLPAEYWSAIQHLYFEPDKHNKKETQSAG